MAARNNTKFLPPLVLTDFPSENVRQTTGKPFGNFGTYVALPSLGLQQNTNMFYEIKRVCKFVCEWYVSWKSWQREILLCSLSGKCSISQLSTLSTILEPVFHRDFVSRLHGRYPVKCLKQKVCGKERGAQKESVEVKEKSNKIIFKQKENLGTEHGGTKTVLKSCMDEIAEDETRENRVSLSELVKENLQKNTRNTTHDSKETKMTGDGSSDVAALLQKNNTNTRLGHTHNTSTNYKKGTNQRFFSAPRMTQMHDMKASVQNGHGNVDGQRRISDLDARCYKHVKWWTISDTSADSKKLVSAHGSKLWNHFARQLKEINEVKLV